ncbi:MAG: hypothetical protein ACRC3B_07110, partial [Bacteroidia bacterium]
MKKLSAVSLTVLCVCIFSDIQSTPFNHDSESERRSHSFCLSYSTVTNWAFRYEYYLSESILESAKISMFADIGSKTVNFKMNKVVFNQQEYSSQCRL